MVSATCLSLQPSYLPQSFIPSLKIADPFHHKPEIDLFSLTKKTLDKDLVPFPFQLHSVMVLLLSTSHLHNQPNRTSCHSHCVRFLNLSLKSTTNQVTKSRNELSQSSAGSLRPRNQHHGHNSEGHEGESDPVHSLSFCGCWRSWVCLGFCWTSLRSGCIPTVFSRVIVLSKFPHYMMSTLLQYNLILN